MAEMSFIFGKGQKARTPEEARRLREFAEALMGSQRAPQNVGEGLMALANGLSARFAHNAANRAAADGRAGAESKVGPIFSALFGRSNPVPPISPSGNKVAAALGGKNDSSGNLPSRFDFANAEKSAKGNGTAYASFMGEVGKDLTNPYGLAAVAATGRAESSWSPTNVAGSWSDPSQSGKAGTAGGAMSWRNERLAALQDFAQKNGLDPTNPETQARFFMQEDPTLIAGLQNAKSVEEAQGLINNAWKFAGYDQPGGESARRLAYAQEYLPTFQGGSGTDALVGGAGNDRLTPSLTPEQAAAARATATPRSYRPAVDGTASDRFTPAGGILSYANEGAIRNQPLVSGLESSLQDAVSSVYGPGYSVQVYSGGQAGKGEKGRRTGSIRHDHGRAADVYVVGPDGKRVRGDALAPLGQYWAANKLGGVGMEMHGGGIHLDNWETPPAGGGMHWNYADQGGSYTPAMRAAMDAGMRGEMPNGVGAPLLAGRGGTDQMLGSAGNDRLAPQQAPRIPPNIAASRFDGPGSLGDPGVQAALAAERGQQPQGQGAGPLQAISRAFGVGGQQQPHSGPQVAQGPTGQEFPPQPPAPGAGDAGGNGALSMENLYRVLQDPWVEDGTKRVIMSEIQRQQQMADPTYQMELEKSRLELEAMRNPKPGEDWAKLDDNRLFNQRTGEIRNLPGGPAGGAFRFQGNSVEAQALNGLMDSGALTPDQAQQLAAGKTVSGPNGEILFLTPQGVFAQQAGQPPQPIVPPAAPDAPPQIPPQAQGGPQTAPAPQAAPQPVPVPAQPQQTGQRPGMIPLTEPKTTIDERKAATFADRMKTSGDIVDKNEMAGTNVWDQNIRGNSWIPDSIENWLVGEDFQKFDQARRDFINAQLRRESGAVISDEEFDNANKQYFPQPNDPPELLEQKRRNRQIVIDGMIRDAGPTYQSGADDPLGLGIR